MNRMFQVIVVGGISLTAHACGGTVDVTQGSGTGSGGMGSGGFPHEGRPSPVTSSSGGFGGFPQEGPAMVFDAGADAPPQDAGPDGCFPPIKTVFSCPDASSVKDGG
jgi:hypothetical protein